MASTRIGTPGIVCQPKFHRAEGGLDSLNRPRPDTLNVAELTSIEGCKLSDRGDAYGIQSLEQRSR